MRSTALALAAVCAASIAGQASAQATTSAIVYRQIVEGCLGEAGAGGAYVCGCTATAMVERCEATGARTVEAMLACVQANETAWAVPLVSSCRAYGALRLGPRVRPPAPRPSAPAGPGVEVLTDVQLWSVFYQGCVQQDASIAYACACLSTAAVAACAPRGSASGPSIEVCMPAVQTELQGLAQVCAQPGAIHHVGGNAAPPVAAPPPAPPAAAPGAIGMPQAEAICTAGGVSTEPRTALWSCAQAVLGVVNDDAAALANVLPSRGTVTILGRRTPVAQVASTLAGQGGLRAMVGATVTAFADEDGAVQIASTRGGRVNVVYLRFDRRRGQLVLDTIQAEDR